MPNEEAKYIYTLSFKKKIDNHVEIFQHKKESHLTPIEKPLPSGPNENEIHFKFYVLKALYLQRLISQKKGTHYNDILKMFKQIRINIILLNAIQQVSTYTKFLKDLCMVKRKTNVPKKAFLT